MKNHSISKFKANSKPTKDEGLSAVVGVMLILTLTIIVASVVIAFSGGLVPVRVNPPSAMILVSTTGSEDEFRLLFEEKSGDVIKPSEIRVTTLVRNPENNDTGTSFQLSDITDNRTLSAGEIISTKNTTDTMKRLGIKTIAELRDAVDLSTPVSIKIYHTPSSMIIHQSEILLQRS